MEYRSKWPKDIRDILDEISHKDGYKLLLKPKDVSESTQVNVNYVGSPKEFFPNVRRFDYQFFYCEETETIEGVVYFGECLQGPIGNVHGGAISTIVDAIMGTNVWAAKHDCVTLNLNVNFRKFIQLNSFKRLTSTIARRERKKIFVESKLLGLDGEEVHVEATSLYYKFTEKRGCLDLEDYGFAFPKMNVSSEKKE